MEETRREFTKTVEEQYIEYCKRKGIDATIGGMCCYMVNRNLITDTTINRFLVIDKYPVALANNAGSKQIAMFELEDTVGIKYETIRVAIKRFQGHFNLKNRVIPKSNQQT